MEALKSFLVAVMLILVVTLVVLSPVLITEVSTVTKETLDCTIIETVRTVGGRNNHEYTIFTVALENGELYTLPKISTADVRSYHNGDTIAVSKRSYKDGRVEYYAAIK